MTSPPLNVRMRPFFSISKRMMLFLVTLSRILGPRAWMVVVTMSVTLGKAMAAPHAKGFLFATFCAWNGTTPFRSRPVTNGAFAEWAYGSRVLRLLLLRQLFKH